MGIRLAKPWIELAAVEADPDALPAQLGVFELADTERRVVYVGYAGGHDLFGLRTAIERAVATVDAGPGDQHRPVLVRYELTHGYLSRWHELLMVHVHDQGRRPVFNAEPDGGLGRLSPGKEHAGGTSTN